MGRGNVCTTGPYEGLFYIDNDDIQVYRRDGSDPDYPETVLARDLDYDEIVGDEWVFDEIGTMVETDDVLECFMDDFVQRFTSFQHGGRNEWIRNGGPMDGARRVLLVNKLFYVAVEDNEWSLAVELVQRDDPYGELSGLQKKHYQKYLDGMKKSLLNRLPSIGCYTGAWTSGRITREEIA